MKTVAPDMGQHNVDVAQKLGYSKEQILAMQADGVLFSK
jgi:crotonobetainyl-CoA:carnitine CoA-transferase CaiB-like acyl-CoA transferase